MNEFSEVGKLLDSLGVKTTIGPLLAIIVLLVLVKKYLFNGFGSFIKDAVKEWLQNEKERIENDVEIKGNLAELNARFEDMEKKHVNFESILRDHCSETKNLILLLKKKTDNINLVDTQYFKQQKEQSS